MKSRLLALACFLFLLGTSASADSLAPCSPNCIRGDAYLLLTTESPDTKFTLWEGPIEELPFSTWSFNIFSTPALNDLTITSFLSEAFAFNANDLSEPVRHATNTALQNWANFENGSPGWSKDSNGVLTLSDPPVITETPEPSTWLLMATGVVGLVIFTRRHRRIIIMSSQ